MLLGDMERGTACMAERKENGLIHSIFNWRHIATSRRGKKCLGR
jgi:hypothetical protein